MSAAHGRRFTGRVAVVTGASRGIGLAVAQRLVDEGARVVLTARNPDGLAAAVEQLGADSALAVAGSAPGTAAPQHAAPHRAQGALTIYSLVHRCEALTSTVSGQPVAHADGPFRMQAAALGIEPGSPVLVTRSSYYTTTGQIIGYTEAFTAPGNGHTRTYTITGN